MVDCSKRRKDEIITKLYNSGKMQKKVKDLCYRYYLPQDSFIGEDILQEVFYHLSKKSADEIIEMYDDNPDRLIGLCTTIMIFKGVAKVKSGYPNHSLAQSILHLSNFKSDSHLEDYNRLQEMETALQSKEETNAIIELIKSNLTDEENILLEDMMTKKSTKGNYSKAEIESRKYLKNKVQIILHDNNIIKIEMEQKEVFKEIEKFINYLNIYNEKKSVEILVDDKLMLQKVFKVIAPQIIVNLACDACVINLLNYLLSYYEREYPKYLKTLPTQEATVVNTYNENKEVNERSSNRQKGNSQRKKSTA